MEWMLLPLRRYAEFSGRSRRMEYWMFTLFTLLVGAAAAVIDGLIGFGLESNGPVGVLTSLALFVPGIAVAVRRLHDIGRSGWWYLLIFAIVIGWIVLLVFFCTEGQPGTNNYGPDQKNPDGEAVDIFA